jgi:hypothetical protein
VKLKNVNLLSSENRLHELLEAIDLLSLQAGVRNFDLLIQCTIHRENVSHARAWLFVCAQSQCWSPLLQEPAATASEVYHDKPVVLTRRGVNIYMQGNTVHDFLCVEQVDSRALGVFM